MAGFNSLNRSETISPDLLIIVVDCGRGDKETLGGIFYLRNLGRFCFWLHNQSSDGKTETADRLGASERSRNTLPQNSNVSGGLWHRR